MSTVPEKRVIRALGRMGLILRKEGGSYQVRKVKGEKEEALTGWITLEEVKIYIKLVRLRNLTGFKSGMSVKVVKGAYTLVSIGGNVLVRKKSLEDLGEWIDLMIKKHRGDKVWTIPEEKE